MAAFGLGVVAVTDYEHEDDLELARDTVRRLAAMFEPCGGVLLDAPKNTDTPQDVLGYVTDWARSSEGPGPTILYWVGHGGIEGKHSWLLTSKSVRPPDEYTALRSDLLAGPLKTRWRQRGAEENSWVVLVLDVCRGGDAASAILRELNNDEARRPKRFLVVPVVGQSASEVGRFVDALEESLAALSENDEAIPLDRLFQAAARRVNAVTPSSSLDYTDTIDNPRAASSVITVAQDVLEQWRRAVAGLDPQERDHFLEKAQSTEIGELGWYFVGRAQESQWIKSWLETRESGMLVVTGEPGAGKSALLGRFVALSNPRVAEALNVAGLTRFDQAVKPELDLFDAVLHLTGKTPYDVRRELEKTLPGIGLRQDRASRRDGRRLTILVDALDEAQSPLSIARQVLKPLSSRYGVRVVVGTRRSVEETPDAPPLGKREIIDALGTPEGDVYVLGREPEAMAEFVRLRLGQHSKVVSSDLVDYIAARVEAITDQPFLFVRLATHEILARRDELNMQTVETVLSGSHTDIFRMALRRLAAKNEGSAELLRALAYAHGRGLPRHDDVWAAVARALRPERSYGEEEIDRVLADAAPYIVLDGEHSQGVHRLAHKSFAEALLDEDGDLNDSHARITAELKKTVAPDGWRRANSYVLAHLTRHAVSDSSALDEVCTDPDWLHAALTRFGINELLSVFDAIPSDKQSPAVVAVENAIRRGRVGLARDPAQLTAQLYARLNTSEEPAIRRLLDRLPTIAPRHWLRVSHFGGGWTGRHDATMTFNGKVRAVAAGRLEDEPVILVGAGVEVYIWHPVEGTTEPLPIEGFTERPTAIATGSGTADDLVAVAARHGSIVAVYAAQGGPPLLSLSGVSCSALAVGVQDGDQVVAVAGDRGSVTIYPLDGGDPAEIRVAGDVLAAAFHQDALHLLVDGPAGTIVQHFDGSETTRVGGDHYDEIAPGLSNTLVEVDGALVAVMAGSYPLTEYIEVWNAKTGEMLATFKTDRGFVVRTATCLNLGDGLAVAAANTTDLEGGYVVLRGRGALAMSRYSPRIDRAVAVSIRSQQALLVEGNQIEAAPIYVDTAGKLFEMPDHEELRGLFGVAAPALHVDSGRPLTGMTSTIDEAHGSPRPLMKGVIRVHDPSGDLSADRTYASRAFGELDGHAVVATVSDTGVAALWNAEDGELVAGPFDGRLLLDGQPIGTSPIVAYREGADSAILTCATTKGILAWNVRTQRRYDLTRGLQGIVTAVAMAEVDGRSVIVRGAGGGALSLWSVPELNRMCGLSLDAGIHRIWFDEHTAQLAVATRDDALHTLEIASGSESA